MDQKTGYRTRSIICLPILNHLDQVVGVAELVNKKDPIGEFTERDEQVIILTRLLRESDLLPSYRSLPDPCRRP
jgi:hypothetical protein